MKITKLSDLKLDAKNANLGTDRGRKMLKQSLAELGAGSSILADKHGNVIAGNKTLETARDLKRQKVRVVQTTGDELIVVQRTDLDIDSKKARKLAVADNRVAEVDLQWNPEMLGKLDLELGDYFNDVELRKLLGPQDGDEGPAPQIDKAAELQAKWKTERGQIWEIGKHRLMCGDSTQELVTLMHDRKARLLITDPPYNVGIFGGTHDPRDKKNYKMGHWSGPSPLQNDYLSDDDFDAFLLKLLGAACEVMCEGAVFYLCSPAGCTETQFRNAINKVFSLKQCIVWVKQQFVFGRQDYHWKHESILYGWKEGAAHYFIDDATQDTVWQIDRPMRSEKEHPTVKPVPLFGKAIANSSKPEDLVLDVCLGAGTTLVACEQLKRICYGMEIEPKYVAVALERMSDMGLKPKMAKS